MKKQNYMMQGQIALVVLVISAIMLTVGLSVSKKSVVETKITSDEELLKQAFNAAESGVDYYLSTGIKNYKSVDLKSEANVSTKSVGGNATIVNLGEVILANKVAYVWLVGHNSDGTIDYGTVYNGTYLSFCVDNAFNGSIKVDYFYKNGAFYGLKRFGINTASNLVDGFSAPVAIPDLCPGMKGYNLNLSLVPAVTPLLLAVKPIGGSTNVAVLGDSLFPAQAEEISSVGEAGNVAASAGKQVNRKVSVLKKYTIPTFMLDPITAVGDVSAN